MKCCCFNKDICILCQEYKYYNIYCTRCISGKVCYNCSSGMLESSFINRCPVCKLESTEDNKWYKIKYNKQVLVPINTTGIIINDKPESKFQKCCEKGDEYCRILIILYRYLVLIVGCLMMNYIFGLALLYMFTDAEKEEKSTVYLILVPNLVGLIAFIVAGLCFKACCTCSRDEY